MIQCQQCGSTDTYVKRWIVSALTNKKVPYVHCYVCRDNNIHHNWVPLTQH